MLPPPPDAMEGMPLKVEYISVMAQAQKSIGLSSLASTVNFIGQLAQAKPEALDKLSVDQAIDALLICPECLQPSLFRRNRLSRLASNGHSSNSSNK